VYPVTGILSINREKAIEKIQGVELNGNSA